VCVILDLCIFFFVCVIKNLCVVLCVCDLMEILYDFILTFDLNSNLHLICHLNMCYYVLLNFFFCPRLIEGLWKFMIYRRIELSDV
jgi:hypothetical protein